jgi:hypothetical protein
MIIASHFQHRRSVCSNPAALRALAYIHLIRTLAICGFSEWS